MKSLRLTHGRRIESEADRQQALLVLQAIYEFEKGWVCDVEALFPARDLQNPKISWFLALKSKTPVGVLRVHYDPDIGQYRNYDLNLIDPAMDLVQLSVSRFAEIGRFAVIPDQRKGVGVALALIRAATREVVSRGYDRLITDVFENDPHSPLGFHTRIIGFRPVATHEVGELRHKGRRITLLLDIKNSYRSLKASGNHFFRALTKGWTDSMHLRLAS